MTKSLRITEEENERLAELSKVINVARLKKNRRVMTDSRIMHELLGLSLDIAKVSDTGVIFLEPGK